MPHTHVNFQGDSITINGQPVYSDVPYSNPLVHGMLMNARFIQGVFDDKADPSRFARFGHDVYEPEANTDRLIAALPQWYRFGLRAFTVGLQGGGPCLTMDDWTSIDNNPFGPEGTALDPAYEGRLDRLIAAADRLGMVVIVSLLYQGQVHHFAHDDAIRQAVVTACRMLRANGYTNVIVEVANEHTVGQFAHHPVISSPQGAASLIELAQEHSQMPVGCSGGGGEANRTVQEPADVILIHGNGCTRQQLFATVKTARTWQMNKPLVCNEDSPCIGQLEVAFASRLSWGYYNNMTKQEPPADWTITPGEDQFFAQRMATGIGLDVPRLREEAQYYLQGFEEPMALNGRRWIRLASLYPESINYVEFYRNNLWVDTAYDEPFSCGYMNSWMQTSTPVAKGDLWEAKVFLRSGDVVFRRVQVE